jgi:hypothetical protein
MSVRRRITFYISPLGHASPPSLKAPWLREAVYHTLYKRRYL